MKTKNVVIVLLIIVSVISFWKFIQKEYSIVDFSKQNQKYFVVIFGDKWSNVSKSKSDIFRNKVYEIDTNIVFVSENEKIEVIKPENWKNLSTKNIQVNGLEINFYTDRNSNYSIKEMDSICMQMIIEKAKKN